jgi:serine/threonine-protein kinase
VTAYRRHAETGPTIAADTHDAGDVNGSISTVPQATSAYRAAMTAMRDADGTRAQRDLLEALRADPSFAAAHLRYGLSALPWTDDTRPHLQEAIRRRATLSEHDQVLATAFAPMSTEPGDLFETEKRLTEATRRAPDDADFAMQLCRVRQTLGLPSAIETCRHASSLDPDAATADRWLALALARSGDVRGALSAFEACMRASPLATSCLRPLQRLQAYEGDCDAALASARHLVSADPEQAYSYGTLADALLGSGQSLESVRAALEAKLARVDPADALVARKTDDAWLAIRTGDFAHAREELRAWDEAIASSRSEDDHFQATETRVLLAFEEGRTSDVKALATAYRSRRAAWSVSDGYDYGIYVDGWLYRAGALPKGEFLQRRASWLTWAKTHPEIEQPSMAWVKAYARPALDAADAREALAALPEYLPLPDPLQRSPDLARPLGDAYRLAGRDAEALPHLSRAAKACAGIEQPFEPTWASLSLGKSLEKIGDARGACDAYRVVVSRWIEASTSSSAREAQGRMRSLGCPR